MRLARRLFARAVETPGGLKIDTIHAFCERLLHLVPFEANVPARFAVLDESQTDEMLAQAMANVLADAASGNFPNSAEALDIISVEAAGDALASALNAALRCKTFLHDPTVRRVLRRNWAWVRMNPRFRRARDAGRRPQPANWPAIAQELTAGKATDQKRAASLIAAAEAKDPRISSSTISRSFSPDGGTPRKGSAFLTKDIAKA